MTTSTELQSVLQQSAHAFETTSTSSGTQRAGWLRAIADAVDARTDLLVRIAGEETHLPEARLRGELFRTTFQARLFAERLEDGSLLRVRHDAADPDWPMGPRPEILRTHVPLGPVLVFAASNFPFAFSVLGGDTVSALAVGCTVVVKAHPGHPELSREVARVAGEALDAAGAPVGTLALVEGDEAGLEAIDSPVVKAVGFTGSTRVGRILLDRVAARPDPIPFYGELGATNPVVVTPDAWSERAAEVAEGFAGSFTLGAGQFCTKPGVVLVPDADDLVARVGRPASSHMLNERIRSGYDAAVDEVAARDGVARRVLVEADGDLPAVELLVTDAATALADPGLLEREMFGPAALVVDYSSPEEAQRVLSSFEGSLTASVQAGSEDPVAASLVEVLSTFAGRVIWNQWPTGVTVSDAQHHGGPWPSSTVPGATSVGTAAAYRFVRPVAFQGVPAWALPAGVTESA